MTFNCSYSYIKIVLIKIYASNEIAQLQSRTIYNSVATIEICYIQKLSIYSDRAAAVFT